jgi:uncharacterized protein (DUF58 family)
MLENEARPARSRFLHFPEPPSVMPESPPAAFDPVLLARLAGLELRARSIVDGWLAGRHRSPQKGFSVEFAEHREYTPGDDPRSLDWKVFGKRDRYQVKQYEAETNLACEVVVDVSESMTYRSAGAPWTKRDCATSAAAAIAYLVLRQNDAAGCATFDTQIRQYVRPSGQGGQWSAILRALESPAAITEPAARPFAAIHDLVSRLPGRSVVAIFTDALGDLETLLMAVQRLRHARHEVIVFQLVDPAEEEFPFDGMIQFQGLERTGAEALDARSLREAYREEFAAFTRELSTRCRALGADYEKVRTDAPLDRTLAAFLSRR